MLYLLYGSEFFLIKEKTDDIIRTHKDISEKNIIRIGEGASLTDIEELLRTNGLFEEPRIIIARNLFSRKEDTSSLRLLLSSLSPDITLILQEERIEKIDREYIARLKAALYECGPMTPSLLKAWVKKRAHQKNLTLTAAKIQEILDAARGNIWLIENALEQKLLGNAVKESPGSTRKENIFHLLDLIMGQQHVRAYIMYHRMRMRGVAAEDVFWKIYWQYKTLLTLASFNHRASPSVIQKETGLHPFVIQKSLVHVRALSLDHIKETFEWLIFLWEESKLKTRDMATELEYFMLTGRPQRQPSRLM